MSRTRLRTRGSRLSRTLHSTRTPVKVATDFLVAPMRVEHIPTVSAIERLSFPQPWPQSAYRREILENRMAYYIVARVASFQPRRPQPAHPVAGVEPERDDGSIITKIQRLFRPGEQAGTEEAERGIVGYAGLWLMTDEA